MMKMKTNKQKKLLKISFQLKIVNFYLHFIFKKCGRMYLKV